jgi:hypothetical protein
MEVAGRVFARGLVAAADVSAGETEAQVDPPRSGREALLAPLGCAGRDVSDLVEVRALEHGVSSRFDSAFDSRQFVAVAALLLEHEEARVIQS